MAQASAEALQSSLSKLQISQTRNGLRRKKSEPVDSWEDEAEEDSSDTEIEAQATPPARPDDSLDSPTPPPPTPSSPSWNTSSTSKSSQYRTYPLYGLEGTLDSTSSSGATSPKHGGKEERRPEKSTAVASRLIAAGIGQKAPKRTQEQREYDQAMRIQEKKKRDQAKEEEERKKREKEKALKDAWGD